MINESLIFDIGAHNGEFSAKYSDSCRVVSVEANPILVENLKKRFFGKTVCVESCAVGNHRGEVPFYVCSQDQMSSCNIDWLTTMRYKSAGIQETILIPCVTFDDLIEKYGKPHHTKIDTEGYEYFVVSGLTQRVGSIQFEYIGEEWERLTIPVIDHLTNIGYSNFSIKELCGDFEAFGDDDKKWITADEAKLHLGVGGMIIAHY